MPDLLGINHLTLSTVDLDRLVTYYTELLGAVLEFERPATATDPRVAVVDVGGDDHLMIAASVLVCWASYIAGETIKVMGGTPA